MSRDLIAFYGAIGDGVADDTVPLQTGLTWAAANGEVLTIPNGTFRVTAPLTAVQGASFRVVGPTRQGANARCTIKWDGAAGATMLTLDGCRDSEWSNFVLHGGSASIEPGVLLDIDKLTVGSWNSRKNAFRRCQFVGGLVTVRISNVTAVNNEANLFEDVENHCLPGSVWTPGPGNAGPIAYQIRNVNAKANVILRGVITGKAYAVDIFDGSFHIRDTEIGGVGTWVRNGGRGEPCIMDGIDGDSSRTFLECTLTQTSPMIASGCRFYPHYDGPLFVFGDTIGPLTLLNNEFANGGYKAPAQSYSSIPGNGPMVTAIGNTFPNDQILPIPTPANAARLRSLYMVNNMYYSTGNVRNLLNDYFVPNRTSGASTVGLRIHGSSGFQGDVQNINQAAITIQTNQALAPVTTTANWTLTSLPSLRPGLFEGQELRVINVGAFNLGLFDEKTLPSSGLMLLERTILLLPKASVSFQWTASYGGRWIQVSPVVTPL